MLTVFIQVIRLPPSFSKQKSSVRRPRQPQRSSLLYFLPARSSHSFLHPLLRRLSTLRTVFHESFAARCFLRDAPAGMAQSMLAPIRPPCSANNALCAALLWRRRQGRSSKASSCNGPANLPDRL